VTNEPQPPMSEHVPAPKPATQGAQELAAAAGVDLALVTTPDDEITRHDVWQYIDHRDRCIRRPWQSLQERADRLSSERRRLRPSPEEGW
jgi:hypothetical protein